MNPLDVDVLIAGAGPAGASLAIECTQRGLKVAVVSRDHGNGSKPFVETLPPRGEFLLRRLGVADSCLSGAVPSDSTYVVWESPSATVVRSTFDPHGKRWYVNRLAFDQSLASAASALSMAHLSVRSLSQVAFGIGRSRWEVSGQSEDRRWLIRSEVIVDACGLSRALARSLGGVALRHDLQTVIWGVSERSDADASLLIEACPQGWWYSLGKPGGGFLIALVVDPRSVTPSSSARDELWRSALKHAPYSHARLRDENLSLSLAVAESARLDRCHGPGWLAVGDAAASFDPLSAHGLCSAIETSAWAAEAIAEGAARTALERYGDRVNEAFERYRAQRDRMYRTVCRFSNEAFWSHRLGHVEQRV